MPSKLPRIIARVSPAARRRIEAAARAKGLSVSRWASRMLLRVLDEQSSDRRRVCIEIDGDEVKIVGSSRENE